MAESKPRRRNAFLPMLFSMALCLLLLLLAGAPGGNASTVKSSSKQAANGNGNGRNEELVAELLDLRDSSPDGIIRLNDATLLRYAQHADPPRAYSLVVFFDAVDLRSKPELRLDLLRTEFALAAQAFARNNPEKSAQGKLFFCDLEFKQSQASFALFGVNTLPHIRHVGPGVKKLKDSDAMDQSDLMARSAESIVAFVEGKARVSIGAIERPPPLTRNQVLFIVCALVLSAPFLLKKILLARDTPLHDPMLWMGGAIFVYMFSVSGAMHNIIRKMPLFMADREDPSRPVFFFQGSGVQLGAEGFAVGFLYTVVGVLLALVCHVAVKIRSPRGKRVLVYVAMVISSWAVRKVIYLDNWKTGYSIHAFWPSWL